MISNPTVRPALNRIKVRRLMPDDDLEELTELLHRAYAPLAEAGLRYVATHQTVEITRRRIAERECYVAVWDSRIIGTILLTPPGKSGGCPYYEQPLIATFHQFAVEPDCQGQGVGALLLTTVEDRARALGAVELALDTAANAHHLVARYKRRGYRLVDEVDWSETNYVSVVMSKQLR